MDLFATCCPCFGIQKSAKLRLKNNLFDEAKNKVVRGFSTQEGRCEMIGFRLCERIDKGELTLSKVVNDIIDFSRINSEDPKGVHLAWLSLHLALGIMHSYRSKNKDLARKILSEMLVHSRGIDFGLFMRDIMHYDDLSPTNPSVEKSLYVLQFCSGMKVDLNSPILKDKVIVGPSRIEYRKALQDGVCWYFDLPVGHPTQTMSAQESNNAEVGKTILLTACENLLPSVVKVLLQYGANPNGRPIEYLLSVLSAHKIITGVTDTQFGDQPIEIIQECLRYCLRGVPTLLVSFSGETVADLQKRDKQIYYLNEKAAGYMPDDMYKTPAPLKHLSRCAVREKLLLSDNLPFGIEKLPKITPEMTNYLMLNC